MGDTFEGNLIHNVETGVTIHQAASNEASYYPVS